MIDLAFRILAAFGLPSWILPAAALMFGLSVLGGAYFKGRADANANCAAAALQAQIDILQRDAKAQKTASEFEERAREMIAGENDRLEKELADYATELQNRPNGLCALDAGDIAADARRMR